LKEEPKEYSSEIRLRNDYKEVRESNAPKAFYDEVPMDSQDCYDPMFSERKERQRIVDSNFNNGKEETTHRRFRTIYI